MIQYVEFQNEKKKKEITNISSGFSQALQLYESNRRQKVHIAMRT